MMTGAGNQEPNLLLQLAHVLNQGHSDLRNEGLEV